MEINGGVQCSQDKGQAKKKGALMLLLLLCGCGKNIFAHAQSVDVTESMFTASDNDFEDAYMSCLSLVFRHWVTNRLSTTPCARMIIESCLWKPRKAHCDIKDHS